MKIFGRVLVFGLVAAAVLIAAAIGGMPGSRDGDLHLAGDYYFTHSGGDQNSITEEHDGKLRFVVQMKVEEFIVHGRAIFVARRPVVGQKIDDNIRNSQLDDTCGYYKIDVPDRKVYGPLTLAEVKNHVEWDFLKEGREELDFGPTMCKLSAVRK